MYIAGNEGTEVRDCNIDIGTRIVAPCLQITVPLSNVTSLRSSLRRSSDGCCEHGAYVYNFLKKRAIYYCTKVKNFIFTKSFIVHEARVQKLYMDY